MTDTTNPDYYQSGPFECIRLAEQYSFNVGNVIKYVWRYRLKEHPKEDLQKALWYAREANIRGESFNRIRWFEKPEGGIFLSRLDPFTLIWVKMIHCKSQTEREFWNAMFDDDKNDGTKVIQALETLIEETSE